MRSAQDVINRIMHDPTYAEKRSAIVVGYIDRFVGVLERPFNSFNWVEDLAALDDHVAEEQSIPQHRIVYFKHNGEMIWFRSTRGDKSANIDLVFNSTRE